MEIEEEAAATMPSQWKVSLRRLGTSVLLYLEYCQVHSSCSRNLCRMKELMNDYNLRSGLGSTGAHRNQQFQQLLAPAYGSRKNVLKCHYLQSKITLETLRQSREWSHSLNCILIHLILFLKISAICIIRNVY